MSQEILGALIILVMAILQAFGVVVEKDAIAGIITGVFALYVWYRRVQKGDVNALGIRK